MAIPALILGLATSSMQIGFYCAVAIGIALAITLLLKVLTERQAHRPKQARKNPSELLNQAMARGAVVPTASYAYKLLQEALSQLEPFCKSRTPLAALDKKHQEVLACVMRAYVQKTLQSSTPTPAVIRPHAKRAAEVLQGFVVFCE